MQSMRVLKTGAAYFALVFGAGFVFGMVRVLLVVPRLGVRHAELLEIPLMLVVSYWAARFCVRRFGPFTRMQCLAVGMLALTLLVAAELSLTIALGQSIDEYIAGRDPVSGLAYLAALVCFAAMPLCAGRGR